MVCSAHRVGQRNDAVSRAGLNFTVGAVVACAVRRRVAAPLPAAGVVIVALLQDLLQGQLHRDEIDGTDTQKKAVEDDLDHATKEARRPLACEEGGGARQ